MVVRQLRHRRRDAADRRRGALRGARSQGRLEGARCRRRQRHGEPRRRAALVRRHLDRLRAGAAGARPGPRRGRRHGRSNSGKPTRKTCRSSDNSFDTVLSTFGVMFTPNQDRAAAELLRVCKPKGQIGLANWTPEGFIGQVFKTLGKYLPPPAGAKSPALWGTRARLTEMFDAGARSIKAESRLFNFRYRSPEHFLDVFKTYYGPVLKAFAALDPAKQEELHNDLHALIVRMNRAGDGTMVVPSEYLEVVITKR